MEKRVLIDTWQKVTKDDYLKFGTFPQTSLDTIVGKTLIPDMAYEGFGVSQSGPAEVTVAIGHLFDRGKVYVNDSTGGTEIDLSIHLPAATRRIVTIVVYGSESDAKLEARTFLTDADTRATVARETATERWRWANVSSVAGIEGPDPQPPAVAANVCPVAYVILNTTGVESITAATDYLVPTLRDLASRLDVYDVWKLIIGTRIDTLASDLLALASRLVGLAQWDFVHRLAADFARVKDTINLPDDYQAWGADHFLTDAKSDPNHADWLCEVDEGVRFPNAAEATDQLGLLNPYDELVINSNSILLPDWEPVARITNVGSDVETQISQYAYQTVEYVKKTMTKTRIRYGTPFTICSNIQWWGIDPSTGYYLFRWYPGFIGVIDYINHTYILPTGEVYNIQSMYTDIWGQRFLRLQRIWVDTVQVAYWDVVVGNHSVNGSVVAQTFINSQDGWLAEIDLFFSRIGSTGDVTVLLCETSNGAPDLNKVLASSSVAVGSLNLSTAGQDVATTFQFQPTFLGKERYALVVVTAGNHYLWALEDTNYVSGSLFYSTDQDWFQGDLRRDLAFEARFCSFSANQTRVQLNPLTLQNGIAAIDVLAQAFAPAGTELFFEVQKSGIWYPITPYSDTDPSTVFVGLPPILPLRAVFVGSEWVQPALGVSSNSRVRTWRPRSDFTHISEIRDAGSTITSLTCDIRLESWRSSPLDNTPAVGTDHRFDINLMHGADYATLTPPTTITVEAAPDDPTNPGGAILIHYAWTGLSLQTYRFKLEGDTDNVLTTFHVAERIDVGIA